MVGEFELKSRLTSTSQDPDCPSNPSSSEGRESKVCVSGVGELIER